MFFYNKYIFRISQRDAINHLCSFVKLVNLESQIYVSDNDKTLTKKIFYTNLFYRFNNVLVNPNKKSPTGAKPIGDFIFCQRILSFQRVQSFFQTVNVFNIQADD